MFLLALRSILPLLATRVNHPIGREGDVSLRERDEARFVEAFRLDERLDQTIGWW